MCLIILIEDMEMEVLPSLKLGTTHYFHQDSADVAVGLPINGV